MDLTSLDVQREYITSYIQSRGAQGWVPSPTDYSDGGISGATADRPAFQRLLHDVEAGKIDAIAVYKIDRLTRSLSDFVWIMKFLEQHNIPFVSVTESLNTADGLGRMILSILAVFAEFERDRIRERTLDKKAAAKKRGHWLGGRPILGYDAKNKALALNEKEAEIVRWVFHRYIDLGSMLAVAKECNGKGWKTKSYTTLSGRHLPGYEFTHEAIRRILGNPTYLGKMRDGDGGLVEGQQDAILDQETWDAAQHTMRQNASLPRAAPLKHKALLCGLIWCGTCGCKMWHEAHRKKNQVHRYYYCSSKKKRGGASCRGSRVSAVLIEQFVVDKIQDIGKDPKVVAEATSAARAELETKKLELVAELQRLGQKRKKLEQKQDRLTKAIEDGDRPKAVIDKLNRIETEIGGLDAETERVQDELHALKTQALDNKDLERVLADFQDLWQELFPPEQTRILHLLIERIVVNSQEEEIEIVFRPNGIQLFTKERAG